MAVFVKQKPKIHAQRPSGPSPSATSFLATRALVHPTDALSLRAQTWRCAVEDHPRRRNKLAEVIEIANIAGQDRRPEHTGLVKDKRIVQEAALVPLPFWQMAQPEQQAGQHAGASPSGGVGCMQPVRRNILDRIRNGSQDQLRRRVRRVEPAEHVAELGKADGRVMTEPIRQKVIDRFGRTSLQDIQIDAGVEEQYAADRRLVTCPGQGGIWSPFQSCPTPLWF